MANLIKIIATGIFLAGLMSLVGCSGGRFYFGTWPLGSDLSYEQKKEMMVGAEKIKDNTRNFSSRGHEEIVPISLLGYKF